MEERRTMNGMRREDEAEGKRRERVLFMVGEAATSSPSFSLMQSALDKNFSIQKGHE